jgi:hypothetical protein
MNNGWMDDGWKDGMGLNSPDNLQRCAFHDNKDDRLMMYDGS